MATDFWHKWATNTILMPFNWILLYSFLLLPICPGVRRSVNPRYPQSVQMEFWIEMKVDLIQLLRVRSNQPDHNRIQEDNQQGSRAAPKPRKPRTDTGQRNWNPFWKSFQANLILPVSRCPPNLNVQEAHWELLTGQIFQGLPHHTC